MSKPVNATNYEAIPAYSNGASKSEAKVHAIIETPKGSPHKYALRSDYGIIAFKEVLPDSMSWPYDYGFVPHTLAPDGDPLDVLVISENGLFSGCLIEVRVIGIVHEAKDGTENDRLIAVPLPSQGAPQVTDDYYAFSDVPKSTQKEICEFLKLYSERQGHRIEQKGVGDADEAMKAVQATKKAFKKKK